MIDRPFLRYFGGKMRLRRWILAHLPAHPIYLEPYVGGGSIILGKPPAPWGETINDLDEAGGPDSAFSVAWDWMSEQRDREIRLFGFSVIEIIESPAGGLKVLALYRGTELRAAATIFRDEMNFAVLLRWRAA